MLRIIQHIKLFFILFLSQFYTLAQDGVNQYKTDSVSTYLYEVSKIKQLLSSPDDFIFSIQHPNLNSIISEIPVILSDYRIKRLERISIIREKMYRDTTNYKLKKTDDLVVTKCLYNNKKNLLFIYEAYNDGTEFFNWYNDDGYKVSSITIHGYIYEENIFIDNQSIKKIIICDSFGYVQYFDLECRVILSLDYTNGKIDKGTFIDHKLKETTTLVW